MVYTSRSSAELSSESDEMTMQETLGRGWANFPRCRFSGETWSPHCKVLTRFRLVGFGGALRVRTNSAESLSSLRLYMRC